MIKLETNQKQFRVVKPQTDVITFDHEKTFRDLGYRIMWDILVGILVDLEIKQCFVVNERR